MSRVIDALSRGDLARGLSAARKDIEKLTAELSGANSEPVKAAARVFVKEARRLASTGGAFGAALRLATKEGVQVNVSAAPGDPPLRHQGRLVRSITTGVVDGVRRVGSSYFVARLLEFGTDGAERGPTSPHPFMRPALENVAAQMTEVLVGEAVKKMAEEP